MKKFVSVLLTFVMIITLASCANVQKSDWQEHLDLGQKYLLDGDYEQAIIEFNKVIEIEPKNVEAYIGLAEAYVAADDYDSAISILEQGYAETGNQSLQDRINELRRLAASQTEAVTTAEITKLPETTTVPATTEVIEEHNPVPQIIKQVSLGFDHSAVIADDGSLYMWGNNYLGQLGISTVEYLSCNPIKTMDNVASVSLGYDYSAAITTDGSLYMWGLNDYGQLGNGTTEESYVPVKIMDNVASVSLGISNSAAITKEGSLYMWGYNLCGQLGNGKSGSKLNEYSEGIDSNVPIKIMDNVSSVSLGTFHSAAITKDGSLYMWGQNSQGCFGNGTDFDGSSIPIKIMDDVTSVSLGDYHSAAITTDGSLYMWGHNEYGQLGNGTTERSNVPIKVMDNVTSVSLGSACSAAITTDGSLYLWGANRNGQLGNGKSGGDYYEYNEEDHSNVPIKIMDNVASVSIGVFHSAAITTDGSLYMWGENYDGQLGNGVHMRGGESVFDYNEGIDSNVPIKIEIPAE